MSDPAQREHDLGGVVDVGVVVVVELERPPAGRQPGPLDRPVAGADDLLPEHPVGGLDQLGVVGGHARVGERDGREAGVPHRGLAGLDHPGPVLAPHGEPVQRLKSRAHHGVFEVVAEQVQGDHRVHGGRLDAAPAAVVLLALDDPAGRRVHRGPAQLARGDLAVEVQRLVDPLEGAVPTGDGGKGFDGVRIVRVGMEFVEREGRRPYRPLRGDDRERHDGLPGPASEVVDVERHPGREVQEFRREFGQVVPFPPAEQGEPDPGEDTGRGDPAPLPHPRRRLRHVRGVRRVTGQPQGDVGLDGGGEFTGSAVETRPGAVLALFAADEECGGLGRRLLTDAQELTEQQILGVHRDVRLEVALPPTLGVLLREQEVGGALYRVCGGVVHPGRHGGVDVGFAGRGNTGMHGPGASVGRRCHGFPFVQWHVSAVGPPSAGTRIFAAPAGDYARAIRPIVIISFVRRRSRRAP
jgi:hypothetical protein